MPEGNGHAPTVEEGRTFVDALNEAHADGRVNHDAAAGWVIPGYDPYADEWSPEKADEKFKNCPDATSGRVRNARLVEGQFYRRGPKAGRLKEGSLRYRWVQNDAHLGKLREAAGWKMREWDMTPDPFAYGNPPVQGAGGGVLGAYLPLWPGPVTRQLYWQDYFSMSAKAFEAYNHDPISWRCVHMKQEFALGKGLQARVTFGSGTKAGKTHDKAETAWQEFWKRNKMDQRLDMLARDLSVMGESFLRYFKKGKLTVVRSLDPASIYDLITDPEDHETVFAYHQQFQTPYQLWAPPGGTPKGGTPAPQGPTTPGQTYQFIVRQIMPDEVDHYRINVSAFERRGRSDLFPALGWIRRLRDYLTSHVVRADMLSRICWDLEVSGNASAIQALRAALFPNGQPPLPGTVWGHNSAAKISAVNAQGQGVGGGSRWDPVMDALVTMVANSIGLPKDWLGFGMTTTRASALVATEPAARSLEDLQGQIEMILHDQFDRVMATAGINDAEVEFTFPSIATEDRSSKLKDLAFSESMNWLSKQTSASIGAKELGITGYDYDEEQALIGDEFPEPEMQDHPDGKKVINPATGKEETQQVPVQGDGKIRRPLINLSYRQIAKLDATKSPSQEDEPPGLLVPTDGSAAAPGQPGQPPVPPAAAAPVGTNGQKPAAKPGGPPTRGNVPADENPMGAAGAKNIKGSLQVKEGVVSMSVDDFSELLAQNTEAALGRMAEAARTPRVRPDDPQFQRNADEYRRRSAESLGELVRAVVDGDQEH